MKSTIYNREECVTFKRTQDEWGAFSNMAGGYQITLNGVVFLSSEALYQACRFPDHPNLQRKIIEQKSPMGAKIASREALDLTRQDFDSVKVDIMLWVVSLKLAQNLGRLGPLLEATGSQEIVEDVGKRSDDFWGAIPSVDNKKLMGHNKLGVILMCIRKLYRMGRFAPGKSLSWPRDLKKGLIFGEPFQEFEIICGK